MKIHRLNGNTLKIIAVICMMADHIYKFAGVQFFSLQVAGRLAFPLFAFCVAEGAYYTSNKKKYLLRMFLFAILSELPFDLMIFGYPNMAHQNVIWTFLLALVAIFLSEHFVRTTHLKILWFIFIFWFGSLSLAYATDYSFLGFLLVIAFYFVKKKRLDKMSNDIILALCIISFNIAYVFLGSGQIQLYSMLSIIPIIMYSGERGRKSIIAKSFYLIYPLHMLILYLISLI